MNNDPYHQLEESWLQRKMMVFAAVIVGITILLLLWLFKYNNQAGQCNAQHGKFMHKDGEWQCLKVTPTPQPKV